MQQMPEIAIAIPPPHSNPLETFKKKIRKKIKVFPDSSILLVSMKKKKSFHQLKTNGAVMLKKSNSTSTYFILSSTLECHFRIFLYGNVKCSKDLILKVCNPFCLQFLHLRLVSRLFAVHHCVI